MAVHTNLLDDGDTSVQVLDPDIRTKVAMVAAGTWDSGSLQLKGRIAGTADVWVSLGSAITADGEVQDEIQGYDQIKGVLGSVASACDLDITLATGKRDFTVTEN